MIMPHYIIAPGRCIHLNGQILKAGERAPGGLSNVAQLLADGVLMEPPHYPEVAPEPVPAPVDDGEKARLAGELAEQSARILGLEMALRERDAHIASLEAEIAALKAAPAPVGPEPTPKPSEPPSAPVVAPEPIPEPVVEMDPGVPVKRGPGRPRRG